MIEETVAIVGDAIVLLGPIIAYSFVWLLFWAAIGYTLAQTYIFLQ